MNRSGSPWIPFSVSISCSSRVNVGSHAAGRMVEDGATPIDRLRSVIFCCKGMLLGQWAGLASRGKNHCSCAGTGILNENLGILPTAVSGSVRATGESGGSASYRCHEDHVVVGEFGVGSGGQPPDLARVA